MWTTLLTPIADALVKGMVAAMQEHHRLSKEESMQSEVLDGWIFKIKIEIERRLKARGCHFDVYKDVSDGIDKVVKEEVNTNKI